MRADPVQIAETLGPHEADDEVESGRSRGQHARHRLRRSPAIFLGGGLVVLLVLLAVFAPLLAPTDPNRAFDDGLNAFGQPVGPFSSHFVLGTDNQERDVLSRLIFGARISLFIAVVANAISMLVSLAIGLFAGYLRGPVEIVLMRLTDLMMSLPSLLLALSLTVVFQPGLLTVIVAIALVNWTYLARVIYGEVVSLREREFVEAARAVGAGPWRIMVRQILPHLLDLSIIYFALNASQIILTESALSFLGQGVQPPTPSWGNMIADAQQAYLTAPWLLLCPSACIIITLIAFNLLGDGLQALFDMRVR